MTQPKKKEYLFYLRSGAPRIVIQNRQKSAAPVSSKSEVRKQINSHVKIEDIKSKRFILSCFFYKIKFLIQIKSINSDAAIFMLSERYYIPSNFESYCK